MRHLSPRELAEALGVSESSLKRWVDAGKITAARTEGGHRRIALDEAVRFIRESGVPLAQPELLGMPEIDVARAGSTNLLDHLRSGDALGARGWLLARYLAGASLPELFDGPVREAMHALGELWKHDEGGIFIEHRGTDVCLQALAQLRSTFEPAADAPLAIGGTPEDDPYILPTFMAASVAASVGLRTINLGPDTPVLALHHAVQHYQPRLVWISASAPLPASRARDLATWLASLPDRITTVIGGRASDAIADANASIRRLETMGQLAAVASDVLRTPA